jgi:hypothetical protein
MSTPTTRTPRPKVDDYLRALGYLNIMVWAVIFYSFPPVAFISEVAQYTRALWLGVAFIGGLTAFIGALTRIDLKVELPGILIATVGPVLYSFSQLYLSLNPLEGVDPTQRYGLAAYAFLGVTLLLPRLVFLLRTKNRLKGLNQ